MESLNNMLGSHISIHLANARDGSVRCSASSGGVVTSLLLYLFDEELIDAAVVVAAKKGDPSVSVPTIIKNRKEPQGFVVCDSLPQWRYRQGTYTLFAGNIQCINRPTGRQILLFLTSGVSRELPLRSERVKLSFF